MHIKELSSDVWYEIVIRGVLSIDDVMNLVDAVGPDGNFSYMWDKLLDRNWGTTLRHYELMNVEYDHKLLGIDSYHKILKLRSLEKRLYCELVTVPDDVFSYMRFFDRYGGADGFLPVIYKLHSEFITNLMEQMRMNKTTPISLKEASLISNLMYLSNVKVGFRKLSILLNNERLQMPSDYERIWFSLSLLDKNFPQMLSNRDTQLRIINGALHKKIYIPLLMKSFGMHVDYRKDLSDEVLVFHTHRAFLKFSLLCLKVVSSNVSPMIPRSQQYFSINDKYYLEDFSISRVYSGHSKGHPLLIMSILAKVLCEFLSKFRLIIGRSGTYKEIDIRVTKYFLQVDSWYFYVFLSPDHGVMHYDVHGCSLQEVIEFFRARFKISKPSKIMTLLKPIRKIEMVQFFTSLREHQFDRSMSTLLNRRSSFRSDMLTSDEECYLPFMTTDDYMRISYICESLFLLKELNNRDFNGTIDARNLCALFQLCRAVKVSGIPFSQAHVDTRIPVFDYAGEISSSTCDTLTQTLNESFRTADCPDDTSGTFIVHSKFNTLGVILKTVGTETNEKKIFSYVYTSAGSIEVYRVQSLIKLEDLSKDNCQMLVQHFLLTCGLDSLGTFYFKSLANFAFAPKLVRYQRK